MTAGRARLVRCRLGIWRPVHKILRKPRPWFALGAVFPRITRFRVTLGDAPGGHEAAGQAHLGFSPSVSEMAAPVRWVFVYRRATRAGASANMEICGGRRSRRAG